MNTLRRFLNELGNTGERPILETPFEKVNPVLQFAYIMAAKKAKGKSVIDFGCGGGYGTEYIARNTSEKVIGFDIDKNTVRKNLIYYAKKKNLSFVSDLKGVEKADLVVSFQVIEHIDLKILRHLLSDIKNKYLKKNGEFFVATVNKNITSYKLKKSIFPFHEHEFLPEEMRDLLRKYFGHVKLYGQLDLKMKKKILDGDFSYKRMNYSTKFNVLRFISQISIVRFFAQNTPLFLKNLLTQTKEEDRSLKYELVSSKQLVDNSYIILCECY